MIQGQDPNTHQRIELPTWNSLNSIFQEYFTTSKQIRKEIIDYYDPELSLLQFVDNTKYKANIYEFILKLKPRTVIKLFKSLLNTQSRILRITEVDSQYLRSKLELDDLVMDIKRNRNKIEEVVCVLMPDSYDPEFLNLFESFFVFNNENWLLKGILFCRNGNSVCIVLDFAKKEWVFVNYDGKDKRFRTYKAAFGYAGSLGFTALAFFYFNSLERVEKFGILRGMIEDIKKVTDCGKDGPSKKNGFKDALLKYAERTKVEKKKNVWKSVVTQNQATFQSFFLNKFSKNPKSQHEPIKKLPTSPNNYQSDFKDIQKFGEPNSFASNQEEKKVSQYHLNKNLNTMQNFLPKIPSNPENKNSFINPKLLEEKIDLNKQNFKSEPGLEYNDTQRFFISNSIGENRIIANNDPLSAQINHPDPYQNIPNQIKNTDIQNTDPNPFSLKFPSSFQVQSTPQLNPILTPQFPFPSSNISPSPAHDLPNLIQGPPKLLNSSNSHIYSMPPNHNPENIPNIQNLSNPPVNIASQNQPPPLSMTGLAPPALINFGSMNPPVLIKPKIESGSQIGNNNFNSMNQMHPPPLSYGGLGAPMFNPIGSQESYEGRNEFGSQGNYVGNQNTHLAQTNYFDRAGEAPVAVYNTYAPNPPDLNKGRNENEGQNYFNGAQNLIHSQPPPLSWNLNPGQGSHLNYTNKVNEQVFNPHEGSGQNHSSFQNYPRIGDQNHYKNPDDHASLMRDYSSEWNNKNPIMDSLKNGNAGIPDIFSIITCPNCRGIIDREIGHCKICLM